MAGTRKTRVPMAEQIRLINECRQSIVAQLSRQKSKIFIMN